MQVSRGGGGVVVRRARARRLLLLISVDEREPVLCRSVGTDVDCGERHFAA